MLLTIVKNWFILLFIEGLSLSLIIQCERIWFMKNIPIILFISIFCFNSQANEIIEKYWERSCSNDLSKVIGMAVWPQGDILATITPTSINLYNATTGLTEEIIDHLKVPDSTTIYSGDFSEDGAFFACKRSTKSGESLKVFYWANINSDPVMIINKVYDMRLGDTFDVVGKVSDKSISILIGGNSSNSHPVRITYNGKIWLEKTLNNAVQASDICQGSNGEFYAVNLDGNITRYNGDGSIDSTIVSDSIVHSSIAFDKKRNLFYSTGFKSDDNPFKYLCVYNIKTGNILTDLSTDPIDVFNNGSDNSDLTNVEIFEYLGGTYIYAFSAGNGCARYSYSTEITVGKNKCDFTNVRDAIASYCAGGINTEVMKPLIVSIDPNGSPYDESLNLRSDKLGAGDIVGDIVLKSSLPDRKAVIKLQKCSEEINDGLYICQDTANVIFKNLIICPSQTNEFADDLLKIKENAENTYMNWVEFHGCVITDIDSKGKPMITNPSDDAVFSNSLPKSGSKMSQCLLSLSKYYSFSHFFEESVIYGSKSYGVALWLGGSDRSQFRIHNTINSWSGKSAYHVVSSDANLQQFIMSGDDQTEGPVNGDKIKCSVAYQFNWLNNYKGSGINSQECLEGNKYILVVKNAIFHSLHYNANTRGIYTYGKNAGPVYVYKIYDSIFNVPYGACAIGVDTENPSSLSLDIRNCTFRSTARGIYAGNIILFRGTTPVCIADSIFAGGGAESELPAVSCLGGSIKPVSIINCGIPLEGIEKVCAMVSDTSINATIHKSLTNDPLFISMNPTSEDYFDVFSFDYYSASGKEHPLSGGADYMGPVFNID